MKKRITREGEVSHIGLRCLRRGGQTGEDSNRGITETVINFSSFPFPFGIPCSVERRRT